MKVKIEEKTMRKILAVCLVILVIAALSGCGSEASDNKPANNSTNATNAEEETNGGLSEKAAVEFLKTLKSGDYEKALSMYDTWETNPEALKKIVTETRLAEYLSEVEEDDIKPTDSSKDRVSFTLGGQSVVLEVRRKDDADKIAIQGISGITSITARKGLDIYIDDYRVDTTENDGFADETANKVIYKVDGTIYGTHNITIKSQFGEATREVVVDDAIDLAEENLVINIAPEEVHAAQQAYIDVANEMLTLANSGANISDARHLFTENVSDATISAILKAEVLQDSSITDISATSITDYGSNIPLATVFDSDKLLISGDLNYTYTDNWGSNTDWGNLFQAVMKKVDGKYVVDNILSNPSTSFYH